MTPCQPDGRFEELVDATVKESIDDHHRRTEEQIREFNKLFEHHVGLISERKDIPVEKAKIERIKCIRGDCCMPDEEGEYVYYDQHKRSLDSKDKTIRTMRDALREIADTPDKDPIAAMNTVRQIADETIREVGATLPPGRAQIGETPALHTFPMLLGLRLYTDQIDLVMALEEYCAGASDHTNSSFRMYVDTRWPGLLDAVVLCRKDIESIQIPAESVIFTEGKVQVRSSGRYGFRASAIRGI